MSALTDARTELFTLLDSTAFVQPIAGWQFTGRVFKSQPARLTAPCVFIGESSGARITGRDPGAAGYIATFPVWVVYDGTSDAQIDGLEEVIGRVGDVGMYAGFLTVGHDSRIPPAPVNQNLVSTLRAAVVEITKTLRGSSFCSPALMEAI